MAIVRSRSGPAIEVGRMYPVGRRRLFGGVRPQAVIVTGEAGTRCAIFTTVGRDDLHRRLCQGAGNLLAVAGKTGATPFSAQALIDEFSRQLPGGARLGKPAVARLRDVHGSGRILFDELVGGIALDEDLESRVRIAPGRPPLAPAFG